MKKAVMGLVIGAVVLVGLALWVFKGRIAGNVQEVVTAPIVLLVVGFALYLSISRLRSRRRGEPGADELSKSVMTRASSLAYYISIYLWLFVGYISDKTMLETHSLVGAGIAGMAVVFVLCWLGVKLFGMKNE